jgi:hypothetical protein
MHIALGDNGMGFWQWKATWVDNEFALGIRFEPGIGIVVYFALGIALVRTLHGCVCCIGSGIDIDVHGHSGIGIGIYVDGVVDCDCLGVVASSLSTAQLLIIVHCPMPHEASLLSTAKCLLMHNFHCPMLSNKISMQCQRHHLPTISLRICKASCSAAASWPCGSSQ